MNMHTPDAGGGVAVEQVKVITGYLIHTGP